MKRNAGHTGKKEFSFLRYGWKQFTRNKPALLASIVVVLLILVAVAAPYIATDQPLYVNYKGQHLFPAFSQKKNYILTDPATGLTEKIQPDITDWKHLQAERIIFAPVPYAPGKTDMLNIRYRSPGGEQVFRNEDQEIVSIPFRFRHHLGTNQKGEDVLSGLIHGTRISLMIGLLSMIIASVIGLGLGAVAGYYGDRNMKVRRGIFWMWFPGLLLGWFYGFTVRDFVLSDALSRSTLQFGGEFLISMFIFAVIVGAFSFAGRLLALHPFFAKKISVPVDAIISRCIEVVISLPKIILIISIAAIAERSLTNVILIIGLISWTGIARLTRAEFLKIRNLDYIHAARASGAGDLRIILRHGLPNGIAPALVSISFGIAAAILAESSLSFLNIGVPESLTTWGSLLNSGRQNFDAWWLVIFPGAAIFITITTFNLLGEGLRDSLDPKLKNR